MKFGALAEGVRVKEDSWLRYLARWINGCSVNFLPEPFSGWVALSQHADYHLYLARTEKSGVWVAGSQQPERRSQQAPKT